MEFTKMHGIGNDFIIINGFRQVPDDPAALSKRLCARRFGVGADGLILALPSEVADARMRIINADGGEPEMCGNGIRCLGKYLWDAGIARRDPMIIETLAGVLMLSVIPGEDGLARAVTVDMGAPRFDPAEIPVDAPENIVRVPLDGLDARFFCVSMGNPHAVTFDLWPDDDAFRRFGPMMECHPLFPRRANIEFCRVDPQGGVDVRVWERGDGETLACGTGACAVVAAGASLGLLPRATDVRLPGGTLKIEWAGNGHMFMTGPAETVYEGRIII